MRCYCCNNNLNDYESTLKNAEGDFLDTCNRCLKGLGIQTIGRVDLPRYAEAPSEFDDLDDEENDEE